MNARNYTNTLEKCGRIAEQSKDETLKTICGWMQDCMNGEYIPTLGLVTFNANRDNGLELLKNQMGLELPKVFAEVLNRHPRQIALAYSSVPAIFDVEGDDESVALGLPCDGLKQQEVLVFDELSDADDWLAISGEVDCLCLVVNATMAMSQSERDWLNNCAKSMFSGDEVLVTLTHMDRLNDDAERQAVCQIVTSALTRIGFDATFIEDSVEAISAARSRACDAGTRDRRQRRIMKNGMNAMCKRLDAIYDDEAVEGMAVDKLMTQLEKKRQVLSISGEAAAETVLYNAIQPLSVMAIQSARDYGNGMALCIRQQAEKCNSEQALEAMPDKISAYIENSWKCFLANVSDKMNGEMDRIAQMLARRMDVDAGVLLQDLDESSMDLLRRAFYQDIDGGALVTLDKPASVYRRGDRVYVQVDDVRRETRNMMMLSVPLLMFGSPVLAVGNIVLSKVIGDYRSKGNIPKACQALADQANNLCADTTENVINGINQEFAKLLEQAQGGVRKAYGELIDCVAKKLEELKRQQIEREALKLDLHRQMQAALEDMSQNT